MIPAGSTSSSRAVVTHSSGASIGIMPVNVPSMTPTIEYGSPRRRTLRPSTDGSPPNSRCHSRSEMTTWRGALRMSSAGVSVRPRRAFTPSRVK